MKRNTFLAITVAAMLLTSGYAIAKAVGQPHHNGSGHTAGCTHNNLTGVHHSSMKEHPVGMHHNPARTSAEQDVQPR